MEIVWRNPNPPEPPKPVVSRSIAEPDVWLVWLKRGMFVPGEFRRFEVVDGDRYFWRRKRRIA